MSVCCTPGRDATGRAPERSSPVVAAGGRDGAPSVRLPAATFLMGTDDPDGFPADGEGPVREQSVAAFTVDVHAVDNRRFAAFVADTGYRTDAEHFGWSFVFARFVPAALRRGAARADGAPWWLAVEGATWRSPEGPGSDVATRADHPVVHVSWNDAQAYCHWSGARLPAEAEWEYAARGGLVQARYPWGDELEPGGEYRCNIWHGRFPTANTGEDGYVGTAPVDAFAPNDYGLHNVAGNVWEWCADWFADDQRGRTVRGGSYLCHDSYCNRYRVAARTSNTPDSSTGNTGFRCVRD